jgi:hypothetical protein
MVGSRFVVGAATFCRLLAHGCLGATPRVWLVTWLPFAAKTHGWQSTRRVGAQCGLLMTSERRHQSDASRG